MKTKTILLALGCAILVLLAAETPSALADADDSCSSPSTVSMHCYADFNGFQRAVREKVLADMRASGTLCDSTVRVRVRRKGSVKKPKPYQEILADYVVSDVNADPLHSVTITGSANPDLSLERCFVPVEVTVSVIIKTPGNYFEKRTSSRIDLPGVFVR